MESSDGLVLIYANIRRPDIRDEFWFRMENLLGERVAPTIYELNIVDWDDGQWQDEVDWIQELIAGTRESVVFWQFEEGKYTRSRITSRE